MTDHAWGYVVFNYASWTECDCGYRPDSEAEFNQHTAEHSIDLGVEQP